MGNQQNFQVMVELEGETDPLQIAMKFREQNCPGQKTPKTSANFQNINKIFAWSIVLILSRLLFQTYGIHDTLIFHISKIPLGLFFVIGFRQLSGGTHHFHACSLGTTSITNGKKDDIVQISNNPQPSCPIISDNRNSYLQIMGPWESMTNPV